MPVGAGELVGDLLSHQFCCRHIIVAKVSSGYRRRSRVVVDVPELRRGPHLPAASAGRLTGARSTPSSSRRCCGVLFDDVVAGEPGEVQPVAHLVLQIAQARLAVALPQLALIVVAARRGDARRSPRVDALDRLDVAGRSRYCVPATSDSFLLRSPRRLDARATPGASTATGFSAKSACRPRSRPSLHRPETGQRGQEDVVDVGRRSHSRRRPGRRSMVARDGHRSWSLFSSKPAAVVEPVLKASPSAHEVHAGRRHEDVPAAPVPRPPQPTRPTRITSLPAA